MVDTGNVEQDVVEFDLSDILALEKEGDYWEPIDYSLFDVDNIDEVRRYKYAVDMLPYGTVIGYRNDVFPEGPQGQADMWDVDTFPGPRATVGGSGGVTPFLEAALIADGVPMTSSIRSTSSGPTRRWASSSPISSSSGTPERSRRRC